jgi:hypothetical protein
LVGKDPVAKAAGIPQVDSSLILYVRPDVEVRQHRLDVCGRLCLGVLREILTEIHDVIVPDTTVRIVTSEKVPDRLRDASSAKIPIRELGLR